MSTCHDDDNDSFNSHNKIVGAALPASFNDPGKPTSSIHVQETVWDKIFPHAKFLRLEDSECSEHKIHGVKRWDHGAKLSPMNFVCGGKWQKKLFFKN